MSNKHVYRYSGAVCDVFGRCLDLHWTGETFATSMRAAKRNLMYQFKKERDFVPETKIEFVDKITLKPIQDRSNKASFLRVDPNEKVIEQKQVDIPKQLSLDI